MRCRAGAGRLVWLCGALACEAVDGYVLNVGLVWFGLVWLIW